MFLFVSFTVLGLCANAVKSCETDKLSINEADDSPAGILRVLREGESEIQFEEKDRDMVVLMGITGCGKTTFALYIGGYDDDLTSVETAPPSGEFIIEDRCNRSSSASRTLESCTLIPTPYVDLQTKRTILDVPGFSDTRPPVLFDIAANYFTKKALDYARRVKLVFLVNYSHVKKGEDRGRFSELVAHITTLVRHIPKFDECIALIATKVPNTHRPEGDLGVIDDNVIAKIADFLKDARSFYLKHNQSEAAQLMDIFLRKEHNKFSRIGIFRTPDASGPLKNVTLLQKGKSKLKQVIDSNLRFIEKDDADFGYSLSEKSKNALHKMKAEMLNNVTSQIGVLGNHIKAHFNSRQASATELDTMVSIFNRSSLDVNAFKKLAQFVDYLHEYTENVGVNLRLADLEVLRDVEKHLDFLVYISGEAAVDWSSTIQGGMKETVEYLKYSRAWYVSLLGALYLQFSGYEAQKSRSQYDVSKLYKQISRLQSDTAKRVKFANLDTLKSLLERVRDHQHLLEIFDSMEAADVTKRHLHFLRTLLDATLGHPKTFMSCKDEKLIAVGHYVLVSQVVDEFHSCQHDRKQVRQVEIFALEKVFIDTNVNFTGREVHQFTIVAPIWDVVGRVVITLNGASGARYDGSASHGQRWSEDGHDGKPGAPGSSAGHFVGVGTNFINGEQLTITAVGGSGGRGQNGGDGQRGDDDREARIYNGEAGNMNWDTIWPGHRYEETMISQPNFIESSLYYVFITNKEYIYRVEVYSLQSSTGGRGGSGGNGGRGGIGGYRGKIVLVNLDSRQNTPVKYIAKEGMSGEAGKGGKGGEGGQIGRTLVESYSKSRSLFADEKCRLSFEEYRPAVPDLTRNGRNGHDGWNDEGMELPTAVPFTKPYNVMNDYKNFTQKYFSASRLSPTRTQEQFVHKLEHDATIASL